MALSTYEELAKEFLRGFLVSAALHENSQHIVVLTPLLATICGVCH